MVQSVLFFLLGFLCAGFLALMIAPAVWRRAVRLTRKRIEATVPLTLGEIQADKDRLRAEFAMSTRRLEMSVKALRDKATSQILEITRNREELKRIAAERDERSAAVTQLEAMAGELREELRQREEHLRRMGERLAEADKSLEGRALELDRLGRLYDDASFSSSNRQIELVARESELEKLSGDMAGIEDRRQEAERRAQEAATELRGAREALKAERGRVAELERKLERLEASIADRDSKLDGRDGDLSRLREQARESSRTIDTLNTQLVELQAGKLRLESEHAELLLQMEKLLSAAKAEDVERALETLNTERARADERIAELARDNARLREEVAAHERGRSEEWSDERRDGALLREQMNDIAAEVVRLTALLDGPDSPIGKALAAPAGPQPAGVELPTSLAERVLALQKAASAG